MFSTLSNIEDKYNIQFSIYYNKYEDFIVKLFNCNTSIEYDDIVTTVENSMSLCDDGFIYNILGLYNRYVTKNYKEMEKYYKISISKGNTNAYNNIADYHLMITKNYKKMKKYYILGIKNGYSSSMRSLGYYYITVHKYKDAEKYLKMAVDNGNLLAMNDMGTYHYNLTRNYNEAEKYYKMAVANGNNFSLFNLGWYHEFITHNYNEIIGNYCTYVKGVNNINKTINNINKNIINTQYYLDIYCNLDKINRTKLDKTCKIYEFEGRLQSHLNKINNLKNINTSHTSHTSQSSTYLSYLINNTHEQNISINTNELTTCNICMDSSDELISWDCHISHIVCNKCYPRIRSDGKCHICRSNIL
jgi:tetratricopeptide (TPR) repeat protein